jgi:hypothetical protein
MGQKAFQWGAVLGLLFVWGCAFRTSIAYTPIVRGAEDPLTTVTLQAVDARQADRGGNDRGEIGRVRGLLGNPFPLFDDGHTTVEDVAREATVDALRLARVGVRDRSPRVLVATVKEFWMDGYIGYKATVTLQCELRDEQGNVLWTSIITGEGGGVNWIGPQILVRSTFQKALAAFAEQAAGEFNSPEFQKNVF